MKDISDVFRMQEKEVSDFDLYEYYKKDRNNFSYWFPKVKDTTVFKIPKSIVIQVPKHVVQAYFMGNPDIDQETVVRFVRGVVLPECRKQNLLGMCTIKNGTFSDKYNYAEMHKVVGADWLRFAADLIEINYTAEMLGAGGLSELVVREDIMYQFSHNLPKIYNGLPLTNEYRIFYDFDKKVPLYIVNYWDYTYCKDTIKRNDVSDGIIFALEAPKLEKHFQEMKDTIFRKTDDALKDVDLTGKWSVDILERPDGELYIIDMALAEQSAYWDPGKCM